jgi:hypothetical protein
MGRGFEISESGMPVNDLIEVSAQPVPPAVINPNFSRVVPAAAIIERVMKDMSTRSSFIDSLNQRRDGEA